MRELVSANLKFHARRYTATVIAVAIAVAFIAAALLFGASLSAGIRNQVAGTYNSSAAVIVGEPTEGNGTLRDVAAMVSQEPGVADVHMETSRPFQVKGGSEQEWVTVSLLGSGRLMTQEAESGRVPEAEGEVLISGDAAKRLDLGVGDTITLVKDNWVCDDEGCRESTESAADLNLDVVGISREASGGLSVGVVDLRVLPETMDSLSRTWLPNELIVATENPNPSRADQAALKEQLTVALDQAGMSGVNVMETYERVDMEYAAIDSSQAVMTLMLLVFPAISTIVAMIVVGTTFQVIFRQREQELALLRTIGATGKQTRRLMILESAAVGVVGAVLGLAVGIFGGAFIPVLAGVLPSYGTALTAMGWLSYVILLAGGVIFTVLAGYRPALRASRVPPVRALAGNISSVETVSRKRIAVGIIAAILTVGLGAIVWFLAMRPEDQKEANFSMVLLASVFAAAAAITLLSASLPIITRSLGKIGRSQSYRLAATNTARNPGRTAATGVAVFIGVTLIAMVTLGAQSLRATSHAALNNSAPIDMVLTAGPEGFSDTQLEELAALEGVSESAVLDGIRVTATQEGEGNTSEGFLLDVSGAEKALRGELPQFETGQVLVPWWGSDQILPVEMCAADACGVAEGIPVGALAGADRILATSATMEQIGLETEPLQVWLKLENPDSYQSIVSAAVSAAPDANLEGYVAMRSSIDKIVNILVMVIVALLAVSVLVALVGITNTLSLSVAERKKENGLLRALGMTRREMRSMLSWESLLIAGASTIGGLLAGGFFGAVGFLSLPLGTETRIIDVPWLQWVLVVVVAVGAALLASVMPGQRASKVSPVEALASE